MKSRAVQILTALTALGGTARVATAADVASPWSLSISGGDSVTESGALRTPPLTHFSALGTLDPALTGSNGTSWRPFAGFALGATHLDAMRATLTSSSLAPDLAGLDDLRFTRTGTVFSQSLETGVEYSPTAAFGLRFSVDANHIGAPPDANDARLATLGFGPANDAHSFWSFPVLVAASYRF